MTKDNKLSVWKHKKTGNLYIRVYAKTHSNKRFSGRKYENSPDKLGGVIRW